MIKIHKRLAVQVSFVLAAGCSSIMAQQGSMAPGPSSMMRPPVMMPGSGPSMPPPSSRYSSPSQYNGQPTRFGSMPSGRSYQTPSRGPGSSMPGPSGSHPSNPNIAPPDTSGIQQALRQKNYQEIQRETQGVRNRADDLQSIGSSLPVEDRLKLPLINHMYRNGADTLERGSNSRDESKIRMGVQQINNANENVGRLESNIPQPQQRSRQQPQQKQSGNSQNGRGGKN